jgi:hypothetical protein
VKHLPQVITFLLSFFFASSFAFALNETPQDQESNFPQYSCVCQVGDSPSSHVPFFYAGCATWLMKRECHSRTIVSINKNDFFQYLRYPHLRLGYVGHWGSSQQLIRYLDEQIVTAAESGQFKSISVDNTACYALESPSSIQNWMQKFLLRFPNISLRIRGNQLLSIGEWQTFLFQKANIQAAVSSQLSTPAYMSCKELENLRCIKTLHLGSRAKCEEKGKLVDLSCHQSGQWRR